MPGGWPDARLPEVTFTVSRYTDNSGSSEEVASVKITSDMWEDLKNGNQYEYLIQYKGQNVIKRVNGELKVTEVLDGDGNEIKNPTLLPRYEESTGKLYTYTVKEDMKLPEGVPSEIYTTTGGGTSFSIINNYSSSLTGSIRVKKFLYLPTERDENGNQVFPAVTFRTKR